MIKLGSNSIGKIYLGSNSIGKAYLGSNLVFQKGGGPSPVLPYTPVDYIETDGTAYINTGVKGNSPISAIFKITPVYNPSASVYSSGCRKDTGDTRMLFLTIASGKTAGFAYASASMTNLIDISDSINNYTPMGVIAKFKSGNQELSIKQEGESSYTTSAKTYSGTISNGIDIHLFGWNNQGTNAGNRTGMRIHYFKIYDDYSQTNLIWEGRPCYYNGEYGMWDIVSNSFFGNAAGSGAFTGPSVNQ